jgi:Raf kinase inhibitor-like YbhB/YbcL family protein
MIYRGVFTYKGVFICIAVLCFYVGITEADALSENHQPDNSRTLLLAQAGLTAAKKQAPAVKPDKPDYPPPPKWKNEIELTSSAFSAGEKIPARHTDDGANVSPPLKWTKVPKGAKELVIMLEDPDGTAGNFSHWLLYGLDPKVADLPEGVPAKPTLDQPPAMQGKNSLLRVGYAGPAPVPGSGAHHYTFRIFALDKKLQIPPGAMKEDVQKLMYGHVLAQGNLTGTYWRPKPDGP